VAALAATPQTAPKMPTLIRVGGGRTTPVTIVVAPGSRLQFKNTDPFTHRLYAVDLKLFPPNDTIKGGRRDWTVPKAGSYEIRDELAPSLRTWVVAEPNVAAIAYPSMKGEFMLTVEQPGDYSLQAYFAGKKLGEPMPVTVAVADLDLSNRPIRVAPDPPKPAKGDQPKKKK
jgi:plastocyanin